MINPGNNEGIYNDDGSWTSKSVLFRDLDEEEVIEFQEYARENPPPDDNLEVCHPVCRKVWAALEQAQT